MHRAEGRMMMVGRELCEKYVTICRLLWAHVCTLIDSATTQSTLITVSFTFKVPGIMPAFHVSIYTQVSIKPVPLTPISFSKCSPVRPDYSRILPAVPDVEVETLLVW